MEDLQPSVLLLPNSHHPYSFLWFEVNSTAQKNSVCVCVVA